MTEDFSLWHIAADGSTHRVVPSVYQVHPPKAGMGKDCAGVIPLAPLGLINLTTIEYIGRLAKNYVLNLEFLSFQTFIVSLRIGGEIAGHLAQGGRPASITFYHETDRPYPYQENYKVLSGIYGQRRAKRILRTVPGGHTAIGSSTGQKQLDSIAEAMAGEYGRR